MISGNGMTQEELRANWEHALVGRDITYTLQAGADLVKITKRGNCTVEGTAILVPIEELRGALAEYDARRAAPFAPALTAEDRWKAGTRGFSTPEGDSYRVTGLGGDAREPSDEEIERVVARIVAAANGDAP